MYFVKKIISYVYVPPQSSPCAAVLIKLLVPVRNTELDQPFHLTDEKSEIQEAKRFVSGHTISDKLEQNPKFFFQLSGEYPATFPCSVVLETQLFFCLSLQTPAQIHVLLCVSKILAFMIHFLLRTSPH